MRIEATVVPRSGRFQVEHKEGRLKIYLKSAPESNKANIELMKGLKKLLKTDVRIIAGFTSRRKVLEISLTEQQLKSLLPIKKSV